MSYSHLTGSYLILTLNKFCLLSAYQEIIQTNSPKLYYKYNSLKMFIINKKSNVVFLFLC